MKKTHFWILLIQKSRFFQIFRTDDDLTLTFFKATHLLMRQKVQKIEIKKLIRIDLIEKEPKQFI
jgi:hypothetical protein